MNLESLIQALCQPGGEATAAIAVADALADVDDPLAHEAVQLAVQIVTATDWTEVFLATAVLLKLLEDLCLKTSSSCANS